jgi:hypothetical protein
MAGIHSRAVAAPRHTCARSYPSKWTSTKIIFRTKNSKFTPRKTKKCAVRFSIFPFRHRQQHTDNNTQTTTHKIDTAATDSRRVSPITNPPPPDQIKKSLPPRPPRAHGNRLCTREREKSLVLAVVAHSHTRSRHPDKNTWGGKWNASSDVAVFSPRRPILIFCISLSLLLFILYTHSSPWSIGEPTITRKKIKISNFKSTAKKFKYF